MLQTTTTDLEGGCDPPADDVQAAGCAGGMPCVICLGLNSITAMLWRRVMFLSWSRKVCMSRQCLLNVGHISSDVLGFACYAALRLLKIQTRMLTELPCNWLSCCILPSSDVPGSTQPLQRLPIGRPPRRSGGQLLLLLLLVVASSSEGRSACWMMATGCKVAAAFS
jgi:hypothetical protein